MRLWLSLKELTRKAPFESLLGSLLTVPENVQIETEASHGQCS